MLTRKERKRKTPNVFWFKSLQITTNCLTKGLVSLLLILSALLAANSYLTSSAQVIPASTPVLSSRLLPALWPQGKQVLSSGIPGLAAGIWPDSAVTITPEPVSKSLGQRLILLLANIDFHDLRSVFSHEIPAILAFAKTGTPLVSAATLPNFPAFDSKSIAVTDKPLVGIYHTHTAEAFIPDSGVSHHPGGQCGDIVAVGAALAQKLDNSGIKTLHSTAIHDYPSFMKAYGPSEVTARRMLAENPSLQMLFDLHRDAEKRENITTIIEGVPTAQITLVVATGQQDLPQPHWQQNHAFAKLIEAKLNEKYPGLCRGIQLVEWRYNQHLHPRALLLEIGSQESSKAEAIRSVELLGNILVEILVENR